MNFPHLDTSSSEAARARHYLALVMDMLVAHKAAVHYDHRGIRPQTTRHITNEAQLIKALQAKGGITLDCSETIDLTFRVADLGDPSGFGWNGLGNTDSFMHHLAHYFEPHLALVGAIVIFGPEGDSEHGCIVRRTATDRAGLDPELFSMGTEDGPNYIHLSVERQYHSGPVTFLNIQKLLPK